MERADIHVLEIAALPHDIGRPVEFKKSTVEHAPLSEQFTPAILNK
ncbi:MAG: hypothetical protein P1P72_01830 [ANME-2 cluster archaeon]|nr:hypothetical protein [ANME-2 cluster archaeon]